MKGHHLILATLFWLLVTTPLLAHRQPEALTTISYNQNTDSIEIVHRLHAHDAIRVIESLYRKRALSLESLEGRARIALYVDERFEIKDSKTKRALDLILIGAELEDEMLYVYQEYRESFPPSLLMRNDILRDVFPDQINTVNLSLHGETQTLVFSQTDHWKSVP